MLSQAAVCAFRASLKSWRHRTVLKAAFRARWSSSSASGAVTGMEEILARVVSPLPTYETREKSPPPPDANSLEFMHFYRSLDKEEKPDFLAKLSRDFGVDHKSVSELAGKLLDSQLRDLATILQVEDRLRYSLTPRYKQLLNHISRAEGGVKFLVDLRADVLEIISSRSSESPHLRSIVREFSTLDLEEDVNKVNAAIFYSISSTQAGLQGVELGNYLIKKVVRELQSEFPHIAQFSSLSPIPGFSSWLQGLLSQYRKEGRGLDLLTEQEWREVEEATDLSPSTSATDALRKLIATSEWMRSEHLSRFLEPVLMRLCAWYLFGEKRRGYALNPVANFHLQNGATMWRLNWHADTSPKGVANSCGIMVNYRYFLNETPKNSALYLQNKIVVASDQVLGLVSQFQKNSKL
ncbi:malonyl-CoA decarboxylase, mitochondrial isoform X2 [Phycodurus eques]|uniref:malonyl-CoA decarboxylase, mitochondrial isoform X2 n=1 Tax=Phycodurus eques TaxID=693459 RepID=UPI002ACF035E|nr:malonyl-CoA decarboxylase, mitochondrial isoform X2 [Phycodurus eques]